MRSGIITHWPLVHPLVFVLRDLQQSDGDFFFDSSQLFLLPLGELMPGDQFQKSAPRRTPAPSAPHGVIICTKNKNLSNTITNTISCLALAECLSMGKSLKLPRQQRGVPWWSQQYNQGKLPPFLVSSRGDNIQGNLSSRLARYIFTHSNCFSISISLFASCLATSQARRS